MNEETYIADRKARMEFAQFYSVMRCNRALTENEVLLHNVVLDTLRQEFKSFQGVFNAGTDEDTIKDTEPSG
jgi:hypothetical protein